MRALTLKPHWAHAIAHMGKRIENRSRPPAEAAVGQRIAIHAGAESGFKLAWIDEWDAASGMAKAERRKRFPTPMPLGSGFHHLPVAADKMHARAIIATTVLSGFCTPDDHMSADPATRPPTTAWGSPDAAYWWHLTDVRVLRFPVPVQRGQLGLWHLTDDQEAAVIAAGGAE